MGRTSCSETSLTIDQGYVNIPDERRSPLSTYSTRSGYCWVTFLTSQRSVFCCLSTPSLLTASQTRPVQAMCQQNVEIIYAQKHSYISALTLDIAMITAVYLRHSHLRLLIMPTSFVFRTIFGFF
jgi:hypothetical protein